MIIAEASEYFGISKEAIHNSSIASPFIVIW